MYTIRYIYIFWALGSNGILPGAKFTLGPSLAFSYMSRVTTQHASSGRQPNCGVRERAPPIFGRAAITLGIGPHSSYPFSVGLSCSTAVVHMCVFLRDYAVARACDPIRSPVDVSMTSHMLRTTAPHQAWSLVALTTHSSLGAVITHICPSTDRLYRYQTLRMYDFGALVAAKIPRKKTHLVNFLLYGLHVYYVQWRISYVLCSGRHCIALRKLLIQKMINAYAEVTTS